MPQNKAINWCVNIAVIICYLKQNVNFIKDEIKVN